MLQHKIRNLLGGAAFAPIVRVNLVTNGEVSELFGCLERPHLIFRVRLGVN